ncbi:MAG TPA: serine hydrolase domain-containing protein [Candidatus Eisenbacteria bacterium]|nr:serine hydrolase domain-containing protein [Candidatus Eisenbacteria bacterium]
MSVRLLGGLVLALLFVPAGASAASAPFLTKAKIAAVEKLIHAALDSTGAPGCSWALGHGGQVVWSQGFGYADLENQVAAEPNTAYRTASIGKSMTATAAYRLAEEGKLDLAAPVQKYCPSFPEKRWPITVQNLVDHTSGIRHYEGPTAPSEGYIPRHYDHVSDALEIFARDSLVIRPGSDMHYTTWGYVLLGCALEGASHEEYRALMRRLIFQPSGMADTRDDDPRVVIPRRARGYIFEDGVLKNSPFADMSSKLPAGGWITTAPDLVRFMNAWMAGKLVSRADMTTMLTACKLNDNSTVDNFGHGWFIDDYHGLKAGTYGGGTAQVSGVVFFVPERDLAVAGIFNLENIPGPKRIALAERIADILLDYKTPNPDHFSPH